MSYKYLQTSIWQYSLDDDGVELWEKALDGDKLFEIVDNSLVRVLSNVEFTISYKKGRVTRIKTFLVPKGWEFDGASIPEIFWDTIGRPTDKKFLFPAMVHDWLYSIRWNRKISDDAFRDLLEEEGVWCAKASLMWAAVRLGGHAIYAGDSSPIWGRVRKLLIKGY